MIQHGNNYAANGQGEQLNTKRASRLLAVVLVTCIISLVSYHFVDLDTHHGVIKSKSLKITSTTNKNDCNYSLPHHHMLLPDDGRVYETIKNTNSSDYTWIGNSWIPPQGVPIFTPKQLKDYFSRRNVLFIGDSTSRRHYTTLYYLMNSTDNMGTSTSTTTTRVCSNLIAINCSYQQ